MELTKIDRKKRLKGTADLSTLVYGKVPPQARDLEEAVLGAIMLEKGAYDIASELLRPECFYVDAHQRIFRAMQTLQNKSEPIDILTVVEVLRKKEELDAVGGAFFVTKLTNAVTSSAHIEAHSRILVQKFIQRELISLSGEIIGDAYEDSTDAFELLNRTELQIININKDHTRTGETHVSDLIPELTKRIDLLIANPENITGVSSGFRILDKITNGWQPTDLIILAARPSVGKTAFALNLALNAARLPIPVKVGVFSLEMSKGQLVTRLVANLGEIPMQMLSNGIQMGNPINSTQYNKTAHELSNLDIYIDDTPALNVFEFRSAVRRLVAKYGIRLVIVDYLQLMSGKEEGNTKMREQEISTISRMLKATAKELGIPVIALSQLNRAVVTRKGPPQLSDLRESGAIEQDADVVIFLTRPAYENPDAQNDPALKDVVEATIAKNRNGTLETVPLKANLSYQKFYDDNGFTDWNSGFNKGVSLDEPGLFDDQQPF